MSDHLHLVDSSIWIRLFRRPPHAALSSRVDELLQQRSVATNGVIHVEILSGARNDDEFGDYSLTFEALKQLPLDGETYTQAARLGYKLRRRGLSVHTPDLIIAASAIEQNAVLLHADSDFDRIAANSELRVESFASSD